MPGDDVACAAAKMQDYESRKPQLARQYAEAVRQGDAARARELCKELNDIATLRFDPSDPEAEAPRSGFDIEGGLPAPH